MIDASGLPRDICFGDPTLQARDVSTCMYGTFRPDHFRYMVTGPRKIYWITYWDGTEAVEPPEPVDYTVLESAPNCLSLTVRDLDGTTFLLRGEQHRGDVRIRVVHTPTRANIHHFSIRCYEVVKDGVAQPHVGQDKRKLSGRERAVLRTLRNELRKRAKVALPKARATESEPYLGTTA
jgi:hypothetical protein